MSKALSQPFSRSWLWEDQVCCSEIIWPGSSVHRALVFQFADVLHSVTASARVRPECTSRADVLLCWSSE
jgi:hypothetical protein